MNSLKKMMMLCALLISTNVFAEDLTCTVTVNAELVSETTFSVPLDTKTTYMDGEGYRFFVKNLGHSKFELEVYDAIATTRSYAQGFLKTSEDNLSWVFWSRDILLETNCKLHQ